MQETIIRAVCWTILHSLWQGLLLAMVTGIFMLITKKSAPALRYNLLFTLLIIFVAVVGYTFYLQERHISETTNSFQQAIVDGESDHPGKAITQIHTGINGTTLRNAFESFTGYFNEHASLVVLVWAVIFLVRFVKIISGLVYVQRIRHYGTSTVSEEWQQKLLQLQKRLQLTQPVILMESALLKIPVVLGWLKPVILVPAGMLTNLTVAQVESILLHELAHIRRRDYLFNIIQHITDTIFFFNPAVVWVSALIRSERENCCDDIAVLESRSRKQFVEALVSFHQYSNSKQEYALSFAAGKNQLLKRVQRIVNRKNHSLQAVERAILAFILLFTGAAFVTLKSHTVPEKINNTEQLSLTSLGKKQNISTKDIPGKQVRKVNAVEITRQNKILIVAKENNLTATHADTVVPIENAGTSNSELEEYRRQLKSIGIKEPGDDIQLQQYLDHGVSVGYVSALIKSGYNNISMHTAMEMVDHGVSVDFIVALRGIGFRNVAVEKAIELVDHGVDTKAIEGFIQFGFKDISLDDAIKLRDHDVTVTYLETVKKKMGSILTLEEYIKLRDSGIRFS